MSELMGIGESMEGEGENFCRPNDISRQSPAENIEPVGSQTTMSSNTTEQFTTGQGMNREVLSTLKPIPQPHHHDSLQEFPSHHSPTTLSTPLSSSQVQDTAGTASATPRKSSLSAPSLSPALLNPSTPELEGTRGKVKSTLRQEKLRGPNVSTRKHIKVDATLGKQWDRVNNSERATVLLSLANLDRLSPYPPAHTHQPPLRYFPSTPLLHTIKTTSVMLSNTATMLGLQNQLARVTEQRDWAFSQLMHHNQVENAIRSLQAENAELKAKLHEMTMNFQNVKDQCDFWHELYDATEKSASSHNRPFAATQSSLHHLDIDTPQSLILDDYTSTSVSQSARDTPHAHDAFDDNRHASASQDRHDTLQSIDDDRSATAFQGARHSHDFHYSHHSTVESNTLSHTGKDTRHNTIDTSIFPHGTFPGMLSKKQSPLEPVLAKTSATSYNNASLQTTAKHTTLPQTFSQILGKDQQNTAAKKAPRKAKEPLQIVHERQTPEAHEAIQAMKRKTRSWLYENQPESKRQRLDHMATEQMLHGTRKTFDPISRAIINCSDKWFPNNQQPAVSPTIDLTTAAEPSFSASNINQALPSGPANQQKTAKRPQRQQQTVNPADIQKPPMPQAKKKGQSFAKYLEKLPSFDLANADPETLKVAGIATNEEAAAYLQEVVKIQTAEITKAKAKDAERQFSEEPARAVPAVTAAASSSSAPPEEEDFDESEIQRELDEFLRSDEEEAVGEEQGLWVRPEQAVEGARETGDLDGLFGSESEISEEE